MMWRSPRRWYHMGLPTPLRSSFLATIKVISSSLVSRLAVRVECGSVGWQSKSFLQNGIKYLYFYRYRFADYPTQSTVQDTRRLCCYVAAAQNIILEQAKALVHLKLLYR